MPKTVGTAFDSLLAMEGKLLNHDIKRAQIPNDLERERISHIPEGKSVRYEKGNAVPPLLAKALGESILKLDLIKNDLKETKSIENIKEVRAKAFSYKYKHQMTVAKATQLALF